MFCFDINKLQKYPKITNNQPKFPKNRQTQHKIWKTNLFETRFQKILKF